MTFDQAEDWKKKHLVTANLLLDKATAVGMIVWIVSLALRIKRVPEHLVWLLENAYDEHLGKVMGQFRVQGRVFP